MYMYSSNTLLKLYIYIVMHIKKQFKPNIIFIQTKKHILKFIYACQKLGINPFYQTTTIFLRADLRVFPVL